MENHVKKENLAAFVMQCLGEQESKLIEAHLEICSTCKDEIDPLTRIHRGLRSAGQEGVKDLQRKADESCPDNNALHNYLTGTAGWLQNRRLKRHLAECNSCTRLLVDHEADDRSWQRKPVTPSPELLHTLERIPRAGQKPVNPDSPSKRESRPFLRLRLRPTFIGAAAAVAVAMWALFIFLPHYPLTVKSDFMAETRYLTRSTRTIPLSPGSVLYSGDAFFVNVRTNRSAFIYLIGYDSQGELAQLFPADGLIPANPLQGKETYRIPDGKAWPLDENPGAETIFLVASEGPVGNIESIISAMDRIGEENRTERNESVSKMDEFLKQHFAAVDVINFEHR